MPLVVRAIKQVGIALSVAILLGQVHVSAADSLMPTLKQGKDGKNAKAKFLAPPVEEKKEDVPVEFFLSVNVPQNTDAGDDFGIYPYPIAPIAASPPTAIANDTDYLKDILRAIVYEKCGRIDKPVPRDWRLQWAFEHAVKRAHKAVPATVVGVDAWAEQMVPYMRTQVNTINLIEDKRWQRYNRMLSYSKISLAEGEEMAASKSLTPLALTVMQTHQGTGLRQGTVFLKESPWWVAGKHEAGGMTYYWNERIEIGVDGPRFLELNERNALIIKDSI